MFERDHFDAIIVGSGPTGGICARTLTRAGMNVLVLEAGSSRRRIVARGWFERVRRKIGYRIEADPRAAERQSVQSQCYAWPGSPHAFVDDREEPYTTPREQPFTWIRARQEGGRVLMRAHGLQFYRFSDRDFKAASHDGSGVDWPIGYADLAPYYDRVERDMGLVGNADDLAHLPNPIPSGSVPLTRAESQLQTMLRRRWPDRHLITRRTAPPPFPLGGALATGRVTLRTGARAREIFVDPRTARARGVAWIERGRERRATARLVVVAASTIETARLLLNSRCRQHPEGLGNSSGTLGRYLMDHAHISGFDSTMPEAIAGRDGEVSWAYIPQFRNVHDRQLGFLRGYGVQVFTRNARCELTAFGEMLPRAANRVTIDDDRRDEHGIPAARITCEHSDNERALAADAMAECRAMLVEAGFTLTPGEPKLGPPGLSIHEVGTARMGSDPKTSVLDPYNRSWDVKNLVVVDGACFVSQGVQNPTLTMMALALRASDHLIERCKRHEL